MQLLVSVRSADEAAAALGGGADVIDAKEPLAGALGAVSLDRLRAIAAVVGQSRLVTAALGDAASEAAVASDAATFTGAGATLVKIGFAQMPARDRVASLLFAAARGAGAARIVAVAYADYLRVDAPPPDLVADAAAHTGVAGVLLDTADKDGPALPALLAPAALRAWVTAARARGLFVALAGRLGAADFDRMRAAGTDVVGVRGAACEGGRSGRVTAERVRTLRMHLDSSAGGRANPLQTLRQ